MADVIWEQMAREPDAGQGVLCLGPVLILRPPHGVQQEIAADVMREQTPKQLYVVRGKLYELLVNCIPPEVIFRRLTTELLRRLDDELRHKVQTLLFKAVA